MAKILLFTKIYDTDAKTLKEVEESVQNDLDTYLGKPGMVKVKIESFSDYLFYWLYRVYNDEIGKDLSYERRDSVRLDDCQLFTGHGCLDFKLPCSWGGTPFLNAMPMLVWLGKKNPEDAYRNSCKALGIDVPRSVSFESEERYFFATIRYKKLRFKLEPPGNEGKEVSDAPKS